MMTTMANDYDEDGDNSKDEVDYNDDENGDNDVNKNMVKKVWEIFGNEDSDDNDDDDDTIYL